ncbi:single-stranded-DNA-specific exonuclease RecJ [Marinithermus hydrothermalis]|uniref:Single-stranded-DNA-specific exonuclease RecJ n=1 Tax=Marinithermus hydrothermalis (strain DSM 14884 / JCM 11576 / T1) TaxID=869210 RepID=F2NP24_MARHT|nr:single-stranded-DNA-specific exonuclease RecJ [Marinithermus hydrothermalis]AEB11612.1 single-stranded-DNA-specific exonuclease RecJ [Marinithermus hydrothermalis DSM 14884]
MSRWIMAPWPPREALEALMQRLDVPPVVAAVLYNRGFRDPQDLDPPLALPDLPGLETAARRVVQALERGERIRVHGDYDADGVTGTAILVRGLAALGGDVHAFIPHRIREGYGVHPDRVAEHAQACDLFITVDCGVTNHAELEALQAQGVSVIVTDHHAPGDTPPPGILVHPAFAPAFKGKPKPTGAGVAFFLLWQVHALLDKPPPTVYADLAAIGTIADVAPLLGINRALVRAGLEQLRETRHAGLAALAREHCKEYSATEIAFRIAPRINAAGRLGEAETALEALTTPDPTRAQALAERLNELNRERQRVEEAMLERLLPNLDPAAPAYVIHDPEGHPGVMGIVASRILERFYKPVFIIAQGKGSVRSTPGISAVGALRAAAAHLERFGGHTQAAGFAIAEEKIPAFRNAILEYVAAHPPPVPEVLLDGALEGEDLEEVYRALLFLEPFGEGNPEPTFYFRGVPQEVRLMGEGRHVSFRLGGVRVVKWRDDGEALLDVEEVEVAASLTLNEWNGTRKLELIAAAYRRPEGLEAGVRDDAPRLRVTRASLREALAQVVRERLPSYAVGKGRDFLEARGVPVVAPQEARVWFALPPTPVGGVEVRLALSDRALASLTNPTITRQGLRAAFQALRAGRAVTEPYRTVLEELGLVPCPDPLPRINPYRSATFRRLRLQQVLGARLALAYRYGDERLLVEALERWWEVNRVQAAQGSV